MVHMRAWWGSKSSFPHGSFAQLMFNRDGFEDQEYGISPLSCAVQNQNFCPCISRSQVFKGRGLNLQ